MNLFRLPTDCNNDGTTNKRVSKSFLYVAFNDIRLAAKNEVCVWNNSPLSPMIGLMYSSTCLRWIKS